MSESLYGAKIDTDDAGPIDRQEVLLPLLCCVVAETHDHDLVFLKSVPARSGWRERSVPSNRTELVPCFEVKIKKADCNIASNYFKNGFTIERGFELVIAKWPYSRQEVLVAKLRSAFKKTPRDPLWISILDSVSKLDTKSAVDFLQSKPYDYWESDSNWLSAYRFSLGEKEGRYDQRCYSICKDFESAFNLLRKNQKCGDWLAKIAANRFDIRSKLHKSIEELMQKVNPKFKYPFIALEPETQVEAEKILETAIKQAIAGPADSVLADKPVIDYVLEVFKWSLYDYNRRFRPEKKSVFAYGNNEIANNAAAVEAEPIEKLFPALNHLPQFEKIVIELSFGIKEEPALDNSAIAKKLGVNLAEVARAYERGLDCLHKYFKGTNNPYSDIMRQSP